MHVTITPDTSLSGQPDGLLLNPGDSLTVLQDAYVAAPQTGLVLRDRSQALILGQVSGGDHAITATGNTTVLIGTTGVIAGDVQANGTRVALTVQGQIYGDVTLSGAKLQCDVSGTIIGDVTLAAIAEHANLQISGQITGAFQVTGAAIGLDLAGADLAGLTVVAQRIHLTGSDIHATKAVKLVTTSDTVPGGIVSVSGVAGSDFAGGLLVKSATFANLHLTGGVSVSALALQGRSVFAYLDGADIGTLIVRTDYGRIDARGSIITGVVRLFDGDTTYWGSDSGEWVTDDGGSDQIILGAGQDRLTVTRNDRGEFDHYDGGGGIDMLSYRNMQANLRIDMQAGTATIRTPQRPSPIGDDSFSGFESIESGWGDDILLGSAGGDVLNGGDGDDLLFGHGGHDTLIGAGGTDTLAGGAGADVFQFHSRIAPPGLPDLIRDFYQGSDLIDLSLLDGNSAISGDQALRFAGLVPNPGQSTDPQGHVSFAHIDGQTLITVLLTSAFLPSGSILLPGIVDLTAADFML